MIQYIWFFMVAGGIAFSAFSGNIEQITVSTVDCSKEAINLCIMMFGVLGTWSGIMEIAVQSGLIGEISKKIKPALRFLFPNLPSHHKAWEYIVGNMTANIMGLGMGATAFGIQAMKELDKTNTKKGVATDEMCVFLIINISSLQLVPVNMIAYRMQYGSVNPTQIVAPAFLATLISTIVAIFYSIVRQKLSRIKIRKNKF